MTSLIGQDIPLEMRYKPTVAYTGSEILPNTVYIDANGNLGTSNLPDELRRMVDPRQLSTFNPDSNAQAVAMVNAALALDGAARPTILRKVNGETVRTVFPNYERTPALPGRRTLAQIRQGRGRNVPLQSASLADLNDAFEEGRAGMTAATARGLRSRFAKHPDAAKGMASVARARDASRTIDPVTGIDMKVVSRMPLSARERIIEAKTKHHEAKAPIVFHPKKTGYKTPNMPDYRGPTHRGVTQDASLAGFAAVVPGTATESFHAATPRVSKSLLKSAKGSGAVKRAELMAKNLEAAKAAEQAFSATSDAREEWLAQHQAESDEKAFSKSQGAVTGSNGTTTFQIAEDAMDGEGEVATGKCGWKCWLLMGLAALGVGGGAYALLKK